MFKKCSECRHGSIFHLLRSDFCFVKTVCQTKIWVCQLQGLCDSFPPVNFAKFCATALIWNTCEKLVFSSENFYHLQLFQDQAFRH